MQAPAFDHDNQDSFLDLEYTTEVLNFATRNIRIQSNSGLDGRDYRILCDLPKEAMKILLEI
jgi:hypothetical protein